jgi:hypothetical protein
MHTTSHVCLLRFGHQSSLDNEASHLPPSYLSAIKHPTHLVEFPIPTPPSLQVHVHSAQHYTHSVQSLTVPPRHQSHHTRLPPQTSSTHSPPTCPFQIHMTPCLPLGPVATPILSSLTLQPRPPWRSTMDPTESGKSATLGTPALLYAIA